MIRELARRLPLARTTAKAVRHVRGIFSGQSRPTILMYHRIAEDAFDPWGLAVSPRMFADQLRWLAANRDVMPLAEFAERRCEKTLPRDAIAITFDDGYESAATVAVGILQAAGLTATIFLPVALIERGEPFWWDELQSIVLAHPADWLALEGKRFSLGAKHISDLMWPPNSPARTPRQEAFQRLWQILRLKPPNELVSAMAELRTQAIASERKSIEPPMSPEVAQKLASGTIEFGSHALTHPSLPALSSADKAREVGDSVARCQALTGVAPRIFAYPYGDYDAESARLVENAGFLCACATDGRSVTDRSNLFALPRVGVSNCSGAELGRQLATL